MNDRTQSQLGFTLIEVMVAAVIFTFVMISVSQLFAQALEIQRRALAVRHVAENAQFVIESVSRELRVSRITSPNTSCNPPDVGSQTLTISHPVNGLISYAYDVARGVITRQQTGSGPQDITTSDVSFTSFAFCVTGSGADGVQARVTMPMTIRAVGVGPSTPMALSLQTTIASRDVTDDLSQ